MMSDDESPAGGLAGQFAVDRRADVPIGVQLAWALRSHIRAGRIGVGERLPGLRELAEASGLNVNTVRTVYQRLEHDGLIESRQGSGTFVCARAGRPSGATSIAAWAAGEAREAGVDPREVAAALYVYEEQGAAPDAGLMRRRLLRSEIAVLERTVTEMETLHPGLLPAPSAGPGGSGGPRLLGAGQLEEVRATLVARLSTLHAQIEEQAREPRTPSSEHAARTARAPRPAPERAERAPRASKPAPRAPRARPATA